jgi:hypothetical protein
LIIAGHWKLSGYYLVHRISATGRYSSLTRVSHADRLRDQIRRLRDRASRLGPGHERDELLHRADQDEIALRLIEWVISANQFPPPEDLIPIRKHRLRRK